jgi:hypothetical protein
MPGCGGGSVNEMLVAPRVEVIEDMIPLDAIDEEEVMELVLVRRFLSDLP